MGRNPISDFLPLRRSRKTTPTSLLTFSFLCTHSNLPFLLYHFGTRCFKPLASLIRSSFRRRLDEGSRASFFVPSKLIWLRSDFKLPMDIAQLQKSIADIDLNHDYISNLPQDVKERILVKLPIKEAVRTSILFSKWIDAWTSIPNLVFEEKSTESELIKLVDMVLHYY